ncbi:hypothetical protein JKF63_03142 [Porcisia hertigi]|uniref:SP-RING-type domain-containing protein n=1 Tax=Porcisia hertigi TaxID=2761500 RepID=A0A836INN4_9TRYP|nr:hypothetical protein JKF63_03142 [Porcisia hertigi]
MRYPPNTQVWVKCDDGVWWPGMLRATNADMQAFLCAGEDCCVELYHSPGELYPCLSTDGAHVRPFHAEPQTRTPEEDEWFANETVAEAAAKALHDCQRSRCPTPSLAGTTETPAAVNNGEHTHDPAPFTATELHNIQVLLDAVGGATATRLRQELHEAQIPLARKDLHTQGDYKRHTLKRQRLAEPSALMTRPAAIQRRVHTSASFQADHDAPTSSSHAPSGGLSTLSGTFPGIRNVLASSPGSSSSSSSSASPSEGGEAKDEDAEGGTVPFVPAARRFVLEVLRHEVFENPSRFVLSPVYHFVDILGAVVVENKNLTTLLPTPHKLRERPAEGFSPQRRVLLVPLTKKYEHTTGWMVPMEMEGSKLSMSLYINDTPVSLPPNWELSPAKEAAAVKTAITVDITSLVLPIKQDSFSLRVVFSGDVNEMEMWRGVIACVFVEEVGLTYLSERIVSTYRKPRGSSIQRLPISSSGDRSVVAITEASVRIQCPITTLTMENPVRGVYCEHLQCMELTAVLIQCTRRNIWNCPLCASSMRPDDIVVNYRLKEWIASHSQEVVAQVEYVVEADLGHPLKVLYKPTRSERHSTVEVVDDEE